MCPALKLSPAIPQQIKPIRDRFKDIRSDPAATNASIETTATKKQKSLSLSFTPAL